SKTHVVACVYVCVCMYCNMPECVSLCVFLVCLCIYSSPIAGLCCIVSLSSSGAYFCVPMCLCLSVCECVGVCTCVWCVCMCMCVCVCVCVCLPISCSLLCGCVCV